MSVSPTPRREIADARNRPFRPDLPQRDIAGDVVVAHVIERERPGRRIAHQQVGGVGTVKAADTRHLQRRVDLAERAVEQDLVLPDVVELERPIGIAQHHQRIFGAGRRRRIGRRRNRERGDVAPLAAVIGAHHQGVTAVAGVEGQFGKLRGSHVDELVGGFDNAVEHPMAAVGGGVFDLIARDRVVAERSPRKQARSRQRQAGSLQLVRGRHCRRRCRRVRRGGDREGREGAETCRIRGCHFQRVRHRSAGRAGHETQLRQLRRR